MKNTHIPDGDTLADEVEVELDMHRALMLDGVGREVHGADVITVDEGAPHPRTVKLLELLTKPRRLGDAVSHCAILGLDAGVEDDWLPLRRQGDKTVAKEHGEAGGGPACAWTTRPVGVGVDHCY
jgi:hypothetical protein